MSSELIIDEGQLAWRGIILFGQNTATYKIALGQALSELAKRGDSQVSLETLAEVFFDLYLDRLKEDPRPQLTNLGRRTVMERVVEAHLNEGLDRDAAIVRVAKQAFVDVIPRFHTIGHKEVSEKFYEQTRDGLVLTDHLFALFESDLEHPLVDELEARWDLLEAAFLLKQPWMAEQGRGHLNNDLERVYLGEGAFRTNITYMKKMLNGYQQGRCFYCGEMLGETGTHVDHVIPWAVVRHDQPWNLVLAHRHCNELKSDLLPSMRSIAILIQRNEFLIASNHPLKNTLIAQAGKTQTQRHNTVMRAYNYAVSTGRMSWEEVRGFDPQTDPLYKLIIRSLYTE